MVSSEPQNDIDFAVAPVVWIHIADCANFAGIEYLSLRMLQAHPDLYIVLTGSQERSQNLARQARILGLQMPFDAHSIDRFFKKFTPNYLLWAGGNLHPPLLKMAAARGLEMLLVDAVSEGFSARKFRFLPNVKARALRWFSDFYAVDTQAAQHLAKLGIAASRIQLKGALQQGVLPTRAGDDRPDNPAYAHLATRPVWLAAGVSKGEIETVLSAHRLVMRHAHRTLLILAPQQPEDSAEAIRQCQDTGLHALIPSQAEGPDANTHVLVPTGADPLDFWYHLASVCFLGQSMVAQGPALDPYCAASHGCAILYGPRVADYSDRYLKLAEAGAARQIRDSDTLAAAVGQISAPDVAAQMAFAAWQVTSDGAELTDAVIDRVLSHLDEIGV